MSTLTIETARMVLRPPHDGDAEAIAAGLGNFSVARMLARVPQPYDVTDARDWLAKGRDDGSVHFALQRDQHLIGMIGLHPGNESIEIGYWLAEPHWGRGLMSEAVEAVVAWHFEHGGALLRSGVFADNPASLRLQEKLGFRVTGRSDVFSLGRNTMVPHIDTRLTRDDFRRLSRAA